MTKKECRDYVCGSVSTDIRTIVPNNAKVLSVDIDDKGNIIGILVEIKKINDISFFRGRFCSTEVINGAFNKQLHKHLDKIFGGDEE